MTEEPYRWLEAIANRREYVREQLKAGTPVFAASLTDGILLLGVGSGQSKVFELFDRHALAGLGHPADIERIRQAAIDLAHLESFTRAAEDVTLRRLVGFGLSAQLKSAFEQIYSAPFLVELLFAELGSDPARDCLARLHADGTFQVHQGGVLVCTGDPEAERAAQQWLRDQLPPSRPRSEATELLLEAWWCLVHHRTFAEQLPQEPERRAGWRSATQGRTVELAWLNRTAAKPARFEPLRLEQVGLATAASPPPG